MDLQKKRRSTLYISASVWDRLRSKAFDERLSMSELAEDIFKKALHNQPSQEDSSK